MANEKKTSRKKFRVAVSGSTVDGREISPVHLREAAENFNPDVYAARVNVEHYLSPCPSSEFSAMGDVTALSTEDITEGPLAGRTALYAEGNVFVLRKTYQNEQAARRAAAAKWQQLQRGAASFSITLARGRAELYPEMHGTVTGFKSEIDNQDWIIAKAEHTIDNSGFTTQLELEAKIPEWIAETE
nr:GPO family capsid scaffolding protein [Escherichia coli]